MIKILLASLLCLIVPSYGEIDNNITIVRKNSNEVVTEEMLDENENCVEVANAFNLLLENSSKARSVVYIENDNYGGIFIDADNVLNINQTFENGTDYISLAESVNENDVDIQLNNVSYTLKSLKALKSVIDLNLYEHIIDLNISQKDNIINANVLNETEKYYITNWLTNNYNDFEESMISFNFVENENEVATNSIKAGEKIIYKTGWWIFATEHWYGTVGFNAVDSNGNRGVVTNHHVAPKDYEMRDDSNNKIGYSSKSVLTSNVDASFVPFDDQDDWESTNYVECGDPSFKITRVSEAVEGARVWKQGATTGSSYGNITSIDGSSTLDYGDLGGEMYMTDLIVSDCECNGGDSGGPLITWTNRASNQGIYGLNFARSGDCLTTYTCKISYVLDSLNVSIY